MGGKGARDKGNRTERAIVNRLLAAGIAACRVPLSGAIGGSYSGDIRVGMPMDTPFIPAGEDPNALLLEVKARKSGRGFATLIKWLADNADGLALVADRHEPLAVLRWGLFERFLLGRPSLREATREEIAAELARRDARGV